MAGESARLRAGRTLLFERERRLELREHVTSLASESFVGERDESGGISAGRPRCFIETPHDLPRRGSYHAQRT